MELFDNEFKKWVEEHVNDNVTALRLRHASASPEIKEAVSQIEYRQKAADKFMKCRQPGGGAETVECSFAPQWFPTALSVEQASSATVACFHAAVVAPLRSLLDMTMGLGVDAAAIATLDGAEVTAIERDSRLCLFAKENYRDIANMKILNAEAWSSCGAPTGCSTGFSLTLHVVTTSDAACTISMTAHPMWRRYCR